MGLLQLALWLQCAASRQPLQGHRWHLLALHSPALLEPPLLPVKSSHLASGQLGMPHRRGRVGILWTSGHSGRRHYIAATAGGRGGAGKTAHSSHETDQNANCSTNHCDTCLSHTPILSDPTSTDPSQTCSCSVMHTKKNDSTNHALMNAGLELLVGPTPLSRGSSQDSDVATQGGRWSPLSQNGYGVLKIQCVCEFSKMF